MVYIVQIIVGLAAGYVSGQFGIGGALVTKPVIRLALGYPAAVAIGTPLLVNIPTALVGAISYGRGGHVDPRTGVWLGGFGALGAVGGAYLTRLFSAPVVLAMSAVVIAAVGWRFLTSEGAPKGETITPTGSVLASAGILIGLASGFLGLGGGFALVPFLRMWLRMDMKTALGTSLTAVSLIGLPGAFAHYLLGNVDPELAALLTIGLVPGSFAGSKVAMRLESRWLTRLFGLLMLGTGAYLAYSELA